jgi:tetratricopeptide (TPR) repeat protein
LRIENFLILLLISISFAKDAESVLEFVYKTEYDKAFDEIPKEDSSACVLEGIVLYSRFDDLGDTLDFHSALSVLENCKTNSFWEPYRRYKIGLIKEAIFIARSAALMFEKRSDIDSKAFYAIYSYYAPFVKFKQEDLKNGFENSKIFSPILGNSLIWILYDKKQYAEALSITDAILKKYPEHPIFLQTRADMLFKMGRAEEAIEIYKQSEALYAKRAPNSIRYWCAVANLAKMTNSNIWKEKLQSKEYRQIKHWMPKI